MRWTLLLVAQAWMFALAGVVAFLLLRTTIGRPVGIVPGNI